MENFNAKLNVTLRKSVLDPQGQTVLESLHSMGFDQTESLRVGKFFEVRLKAKDEADAKIQIDAMCDKLLINPVIEDYTVELEKIA